MALHDLPSGGAKTVHKVSIVAAVFMGLAALIAAAAVPVIFFDPDANVMGAAGSLLVVALLNATFGYAVIASWRNRPGLIAIAVLVAGIGLFALDGAASLATHHRAPGILPLMFWAVVGADAIAAVITTVAAIGAPRTGAVKPAS